MENPAILRFFNLIKPHFYLLELFEGYTDKSSDERSIKFIKNIISEHVSFNHTFSEDVSDFDSPRMFNSMVYKFINNITDIAEKLMTKDFELELDNYSFIVDGDNELLILDSEDDVINMNDMGAVLIHLFIDATLNETRITTMQTTLKPKRKEVQLCKH